jgi:hypothetical protein
MGNVSQSRINEVARINEVGGKAIMAPAAPNIVKSTGSVNDRENQTWDAGGKRLLFRRKGEANSVRASRLYGRGNRIAAHSLRMGGTTLCTPSGSMIFA